MLRLQGSDLCDLKPDRCVALCQIVVYPHLTEDWEPTSPSNGIRAISPDKDTHTVQKILVQSFTVQDMLEYEFSEFLL